MYKTGQIHWLRWKERLKKNKIAKFESDLLKTNEDIAPQSHEILQMFVWWLVRYTAVFILGHDTKNGCVAEHMVGGTNLPQWPPQKQFNSIVTV